MNKYQHKTVGIILRKDQSNSGKPTLLKKFKANYGTNISEAYNSSNLTHGIKSTYLIQEQR